MFRSLLLLAFTSLVPLQTNGALDVSKLTIGAATMIAELDLGKLKGELRRLSWSPDIGRTRTGMGGRVLDRQVV